MRDPSGSKILYLRACAFAEWQSNFGTHLLVAGLAAATLLGQPSIAEAGVVIEQPKTKKVSRQSLLGIVV